MSPTYGHEEDFVGSGPLFPVCPNAEKAKKEIQEKTFGYLVRLLQFFNIFVTDRRLTFNS